MELVVARRCYFGFGTGRRDEKSKSTNSIAMLAQIHSLFISVDVGEESHFHILNYWRVLQYSMSLNHVNMFVEIFACDIVA